VIQKSLQLKFHGKILDQLGFQTYQSPVASLSELVANAWDADAATVRITLPDSTKESAEIVIEDNGNGMTLEECQELYLNVGYDRRKGDPLAKTRNGRNVMGRKGIGKFAGFGIAQKIHIETVSSATGERSVFTMDINKLRSDEYIKEGGDISAETTGPDESSKERHGTKVVLQGLSLNKAISAPSFSKSMARRFLVHQTSDEFQIYVNGEEIPKAEDTSNVEFTFPKDYDARKSPDGMRMDDEGWGVEELSGGHKIRWKFFFNKETISDGDLQGVTIFANGKLVQKPFFFNLSGGLGGQAGQSYMFGQVVADYVDQLAVDPISAERQRVNWEIPETAPLLEWGQERVRQLLRVWHDKRGEKKHMVLEKRVSGFSERLERLGKYERKTVKNVLTKLGGFSTLSQEKYEDMAKSILTAWEGGRLKEMWTKIANTENLSETDFLDILMETNVVSSLNVGESIKTKLTAISKLKERIEEKDLENAIRDHLANNPWIISPKWDMFKKEVRVKTILEECATRSELSKNPYVGRVDLVLSSGTQLLVLEFMRPGLKLDWDHISRCERYIMRIRSSIESQTGLEFTSVSGYVVADRIDTGPDVRRKIQDLKKSDIVVTDWNGLLDNAIAYWDEYLHILVERGSGDTRLENLLG